MMVPLTVGVPPNLPYNLGEPLRDFWRRRLDVHTHDSYRGRVLAKMPEDLRTYQHLIEECQPDVIVEIGTYDGGSALWFADQLGILSPRDWRTSFPSVVTLDIKQMTRSLDDPRISFLIGDIKDPASRDAIRSKVAGKKVMITEDGHHSYDTTLAALMGLADLVPRGSWIVVEDGVVDEVDLKLPRYRGGVQPAINTFLASKEGERFSQHHLQPYGFTTDFGGWLKAER